MKLLPTVMAQLTDDNPHVRSTGVHSEGEAHVHSAGAHNGGEAHDTTDRPLGGDTGCLPKKRKSQSHGTNTEVKRRRNQELNHKKCGATRLQTDNVCTCILIYILLKYHTSNSFIILFPHTNDSLISISLIYTSQILRPSK